MMPSLIYEIRVRGHLSQTLSGAFPALQVGREGSDTILKGPLEDEAALHGILVQIEMLGVELLEVRRLPAGQNRQAASQRDKADRDFVAQEGELESNTELTWAIHALTIEIHRPVGRLDPGRAADEPAS
jgi:hypothetical protein